MRKKSQQVNIIQILNGAVKPYSLGRPSDLVLKYVLFQAIFFFYATRLFEIARQPTGVGTNGNSKSAFKKYPFPPTRE